jgi:hypothetical protein
MSTTDERLADMGERTVWNLARLAECADPERLDSPGADFLASVRDEVIERIQYVLAEGQTVGVDSFMDEHGTEIADLAPDVYTYKRWQEFVDLAAWQEDPSELGSASDDMTEAAGACLYLIADRLIRALLEDWEADE